MSKLTQCAALFIMMLYRFADLGVMAENFREITCISDGEVNIENLGPELLTYITHSRSDCASVCLSFDCPGFLYIPTNGLCVVSNLSRLECDIPVALPRAPANYTVMRCLVKRENIELPVPICPSVVALGMESGEIPDTAISVSEEETNGGKWSKNNARLYYSGGWSSPWIKGLTTHNYWIAVTFGTDVVIHSVDTMGCRDCVSRFVKKYSVQYLNKNGNWVTVLKDGIKQIFQGNLKREVVATTVFDSPIFGRGFKLQTEKITLVDVGGEPTPVLGLRMELYGCYV